MHGIRVGTCRRVHLTTSSKSIKCVIQACATVRVQKEYVTLKECTLHTWTHETYEGHHAYLGERMVVDTFQASRAFSCDDRIGTWTGVDAGIALDLL